MVKNRTALLVLAMHRSGSSLLAGVIAAAGVPVGTDLAQPDRHNPTGYWESRSINRVLEEILQSAESRWHDWRRLSFPDPQKQARAVQSLRDVVEENFPTAELFAIKDPRSCRLASAWRAALDMLGIRQKIIVSVRHPCEVALSLNARDGMPIDKGILLWTRHVLDALVDTRGLPATIVRYEDVLTDGRAELERIATVLDIAWPAEEADMASGLGRLITPGLRHHRHAETDLAAFTDAAWAHGLWSLLQDGDAAIRETATVDALAAEFTQAIRPFENYFCRLEAGYESALAQIKILRQELDRAKWRLGDAAVRADGSLGDPQRTIHDLAARVAAMEAAVFGAK
jgi:hypothetical protein